MNDPIFTRNETGSYEDPKIHYYNYFDPTHQYIAWMFQWKKQQWENHKACKELGKARNLIGAIQPEIPIDLLISIKSKQPPYTVDFLFALRQSLIKFFKKPLANNLYSIPTIGLFHRDVELGLFDFIFNFVGRKGDYAVVLNASMTSAHYTFSFNRGQEPSPTINTQCKPRTFFWSLVYK